MAPPLFGYRYVSVTDDVTGTSGLISRAVQGLLYRTVLCCAIRYHRNVPARRVYKRTAYRSHQNTRSRCQDIASASIPVPNASMVRRGEGFSRRGIGLGQLLRLCIVELSIIIKRPRSMIGCVRPRPKATVQRSTFPRVSKCFKITEESEYDSDARFLPRRGPESLPGRTSTPRYYR